MISWAVRVHRVQDHVRANLREDLDLEGLARVAHASRFHFARIFKAHTGETLNQFVRRARLERAAGLMRARPDIPLLEVALEAGFSGAPDFSRVFKQVYGLAPSRWDRQSALNDSLPGFEDGLAAARVDCPPLLARVRQHPAARVAYVRIPTPFMDVRLLEQGYAQLRTWFEGRGIDWRQQPLIGMSWDNPETTPLDKVRFDLGFTLPAGVQARELGQLELPAMRSVDVRVQGHLGHIALAWEHLYEQVLPGSSHEPADLPGIKRFNQRPDQLGWRRFDLDCCIGLI